MDKIDQYLDMIINDYADKPDDEGYSIEVQFVPKHELMNIVELMFNEDTSLQDLILCHLQKFINERIPKFESEQRYWRKSA